MIAQIDAFSRAVNVRFVALLRVFHPIKMHAYYAYHAAFAH
jgi:hypothetical protein